MGQLHQKMNSKKEKKTSTSRTSTEMKHITLFLIIFAGFCTNCNTNISDNTSTMIHVPVCKKIPKELSIHGDTRIDDYYWLNDRENPDVIDYLNLENEYTDKQLAHTEKMQEQLFEEIVARIKQTDESVPYKHNHYWYITRFEEGQEYPIYSRKKESLDAVEEITLDLNELAKGHAYYQIGGQSVSPDNKILAFGVDTVSRRIYTVKFKNLETGEILEDELQNTTGSATWANDNKTLFYTLKDETTLRGHKIFRHILGTPQSEDVEIFHEEDESFGTYVYKSKSKQFLIIGSYSTVSTEYQILDANHPLGEFSIIQPRERDHEYGIAHYKDHFYITTNLGAKNFRLMKTETSKPGKENWEEVLPHREDVLIEGIEIFEKYLVVEERKNGLTELRIIHWESEEEHYLDFGEPAYTAWTSVNPDFDSEILRFGYTSMTTPSSTFDYNISTREKELLKEQEVVGSFDKNDYTSERIYVEARDGIKVPVSLVYKKDIEVRAKNPLLLYGYGSYGSSMDPYFSSVRLSLLDRGFVYAIAHIRGGEEMGRQWYEDGKLLHKKNTFNDFIDCAKYLIDQNYTSPEQLCAMGGSAGGLLMGAVINQSPEIFKAVVAQVPFVDVVTTMLDESIPLTTGEFDEWGNPKEEEYYHYIKSYSPYDNIERKEYPALLVTTGLHDSQVQYWEPAKWVAKLRELKTDSNLLLLKTDMETGHGGKSGRFERYKEVALEYAFLFDQLKVKL